MKMKSKRIDDAIVNLQNMELELDALYGYLPEYEHYKKKVDSFAEIIANQESRIADIERRLRGFDD